MRADLTPSKVRLTDGAVFDIAVTVTNSADIISGHSVRVLGVDPDCVTVDQDRLALFPGGTGVITVTVALPRDLPAGVRTLTVEVTEDTLPRRTLLLPVEVEVPAKPKLQLRLEPRSITAGRRAPFAMVAENTGNSRITLPLSGIDDEAAITYRFNPPVVDLEPGARAAIDLEVSAKRRIAGQMVVRTFSLLAADPDAAAVGGEPLAVTQGTLIQKPLISRGGISLVGLLAAVSVFAIILTLALTRVSTQSAADRDLAVQVALTNAASTAGTGTAGVSGTVRLLTSGSGVGGVTVDLFNASDTANPVTTAATDDTGAYTLSGIPAGSYKLRFRGAGFAELWYPDALTDSDATQVNVTPGVVSKNVDVRIGGLPATLAGNVTGVGSAGSGATVTLQVAGNGPPVITDITPPAGGSATAVGSTQVTAPTAAVPLPVLATPTEPTAVASSGIPPTVVAPTVVAPTVVASAAGASAAANLRLQSHLSLSAQAARAARAAPAAPAALRAPRADPSTAPSLTIPVPPAVTGGTGAGGSGDGGSSTPAATVAGAVLQTVTADAGGMFTFSQVPSPGVYDVIVRKAGYAISTDRIDLSGGENRTGVLVRLQQGDGLVAGLVTDAKGPVPLATVTASDGLTSVQTFSDSTGAFTLRGLATPSSYSVTFSKTGYATQDLSYQLSAAQKLTGVAVTLNAQNASLSGVVSSASSSLGPSGELTPGTAKPLAQPASGVTVSVSSGALTLSTVTESGGVKGAQQGHWTISGLPVPATYTITFSRADLAAQTLSVSLDAQGAVVGDTTGKTTSQLSPTLVAATASLHGLVTQLAVNGMPAEALGEIPVTLTSTTTTYAVTTASVPTAEAGYYEIDNITPGTYTLSAGRKGTRPVTLVVALAAGQDANEPLGLTLPASISGTVTGSGGQPLFRAEVRLFLATNYPNTPVTTTLTDAAGHYSFPDVDAPANYVVDADYPAGSSPGASRTVTVEPSTTVTADLQLGDAGAASSTPSPAPLATCTASAGGC